MTLAERLASRYVRLALAEERLMAREVRLQAQYHGATESRRALGEKHPTFVSVSRFGRK